MESKPTQVLEVRNTPNLAHAATRMLIGLPALPATIFLGPYEGRGKEIFLVKFWIPFVQGTCGCHRGKEEMMCVK